MLSGTRNETPRSPSVSPKERVETAIRAEAHEIIQLMRRHSESQVESWRKVPWLALQADGRVARFYTNSWFEVAYKNGLWTLPVSNGFSKIAAYVDCDTGKLVDFQLNPLCDTHVLAASAQIKDLDAEGVIAGLIAAATEKYPGSEDAFWVAPRAKAAVRWRAEIAELCGLEEIYRRKRPPQWILPS